MNLHVDFCLASSDEKKIKFIKIKHEQQTSQWQTNMHSFLKLLATGELNIL